MKREASERKKNKLGQSVNDMRGMRERNTEMFAPSASLQVTSLAGLDEILESPSYGRTLFDKKPGAISNQ